MQCPKCGFVVASQSECPQCGVIFSKIKGGLRPAYVPPQRSGGGSLGTLLIGLALGGIAATVAFYFLTREDPTPNDDGVEVGAASEADEPALTEPGLPETEPLARAGRSGAASDVILDKKVRPAPKRTIRTLVHQGSWSRGANAFRQARKRQRNERVAVVLYVGVDWCPYCRQFEGKIMHSGPLTRALGPVVKVELNPDKSKADDQLATELGIKGFPTLMLFATADAKPKRLPTGVSKGSNPNPEAVEEAVREHLRYAWHTKAHASYREQRYDETIVWADQTLAVAPKDDGGKLYHLRALAFLERKEYREALRDFALACGSGNKADCDYLERRR